jgi:hypothetical protein
MEPTMPPRISTFRFYVQRPPMVASAFPDPTAVAPNATLLLATLLLATLPISGCASLGLSSGGSGKMEGITTGNDLALDLPTRIFDDVDLNTADVYMTDLPREVWMGDNGQPFDATQVRGTLVHIRLFLRPSAGDTPIQASASTATVRTLVLSGGELGLYAGAGFLRVSGGPGDDSLSGTLNGGTLRLRRATGGFNDQLGPSTFDGSFSATRDKAQARAMARALLALSAVGTPTEE